MMKLLVSDFDNTLRRNGEISKEDFDAITKWQKQGNLFALCTGRYLSPLTGIENEPYCDYTLCCSGALIYEANSNCISSIKGKNSDIALAYDYCKNFDIEGGIFRAFTEKGLFEYCDNQSFQKEYRDIGDFYQLGIAFTDEAAAIDFTKRAIEELNVVSILRNGRWLDLPTSGVTKAKGIALLAEILNIKKEDIFTVGDSMNDAHMVSEFTGFAMKNGSELLKALATATVESISELINNINHSEASCSEAALSLAAFSS